MSEEQYQGEQKSIHNMDKPRTRASLASDLRALGVEAGITLLMHSSLSKLGWVAGGPVAVVQALMDVVTLEGTIVMPAFTSHLTDPAKWQHPPVPQSWWQTIYEEMPAFEPEITPTRMMGQIVETFRRWPGVIRSNHPTDSFAAWGKDAREITEGHQLEYGVGEGSPLACIYDLNGYVLLLGVGFGNNTSFHLAEYRVPNPPEIRQGSPILENGKRVWKWYQDVDIDDEPFPEIGAAFEQTGLVKVGKVGSAEARLFPQRPAVDFALQWMLKKRDKA